MFNLKLYKNGELVRNWTFYTKKTAMDVANSLAKAGFGVVLQRRLWFLKITLFRSEEHRS